MNNLTVYLLGLAIQLLGLHLDNYFTCLFMIFIQLVQMFIHYFYLIIKNSRFSYLLYLATYLKVIHSF